MSSAILAAVLSSVVNGAVNYAAAREQRNWNEQMQDKQNDYNLPANQLQRLKDAGINPNAMSQGTNVVGNQSAPVLPYQTPDLQDVLSVASNSALQLSQQKTEDALRQVRVEEAMQNIEVLKQTALKLGLESQYQTVINGFAAAEKKAALSESWSRTALNWRQNALVRQQSRELAKRIDEIMPQELRNLVAQENLTVAQLPEILARIANLNSSTELNKEQRNTEEIRQAEGLANIELTHENIEGQHIENRNAQDIANLVMRQYEATINKLVEDTNLTHEQAYYYLFELSKKYAIRVAGAPVPGLGGIKDVNTAKSIGNRVHKKYGFGPEF